MFSFSYFLLVNFDPTKGFIKADSKSTLPHFIMNHHELLTLIQSCQAILTFLVDRGLLAARRRCSCGDEMVLRDDKSDDGYHWECPVNQCRKRRSIRARYVQKCTQQQKWQKWQNYANNNLEANANEKTRGPPCKAGEFGEFGESGKNGKLVKIADNNLEANANEKT